MTVTAGPAFVRPQAHEARETTTPEPPPALDEAAERYLRASVGPGAPAATTVRMRLRGTIRLGRWWAPFRALEVVSPVGYVRVAHIDGLARVTDTLLPDGAVRRVRLAGRIVTADDGPDPARRGAGHLALARTWTPGAVHAATARAVNPYRLRVAGENDDPIDAVYELHPQGLPLAATTRAWGDPTGGCRPDWFDYGGPILEHRTWYGTTVPATGVFGWFPDTRHFVPVVRWQLTSWAALDHRRVAGPDLAV